MHLTRFSYFGFLLASIYRSSSFPEHRVRLAASCWLPSGVPLFLSFDTHVRARDVVRLLQRERPVSFFLSFLYFKQCRRGRFEIVRIFHSSPKRCFATAICESKVN